MSCHYVLQTMTRVFFINTNTLAPLIYFWFLQANDNTIRMQIEVVLMHNYVRTRYVLKWINEWHTFNLFNFVCLPFYIKQLRYIWRIREVRIFFSVLSGVWVKPTNLHKPHRSSQTFKKIPYNSLLRFF